MSGREGSIEVGERREKEGEGKEGEMGERREKGRKGGRRKGGRRGKKRGERMITQHVYKGVDLQLRTPPSSLSQNL